jgi:hypothetical protein
VVNVPSTVTTIAESAFARSEVRRITGAANLRVIDKFAFSGCLSLTEFSVPNNVVLFEAPVFSGCAQLLRITFGPSLREIGASAFAACVNLVRVDFSCADHNDRVRGIPGSLSTVSVGRASVTFLGEAVMRTELTFARGF